MDTDFVVSYTTMYDERSYRAYGEYDSETDDDGEELNEYGQPEIVPPWLMEV